MGRLWTGLVLFPALALAGCLGGGGDDASDDEPITKAAARAQVSDDTGGVEGLVTDNAVAPVAGATVTLVEQGLTAVTGPDGTYAVSDVRPGSYTLSVAADGFVPASVPVDVVRGRAAFVDVVLLHVLGDLPYVTPLEFEGYIECSIVVGWTQPVPVGFSFSSTDCVPVGGATNQRIAHAFDLDPPLHTLVIETVWDSVGATGGDHLAVGLRVAGSYGAGVRVCPCPDMVGGADGTSPLSYRLDRTGLEGVQANFTAKCDEGEQDYCGRSFFDEGWPLYTLVWPSPRCRDVPVIACVPLQQTFTHSVTAFYNAPAPEGYSALSS